MRVASTVPSGRWPAACGREEQELDAEVARIQADIDDEQRLEAEGDFPAAFAPPSRPHRGDDEEDEVSRRIDAAF